MQMSLTEPGGVAMQVVSHTTTRTHTRTRARTLAAEPRTVQGFSKQSTNRKYVQHISFNARKITKQFVLK